MSLKHKADNYKAIGGKSFNILTQCIPESHDNLKPSKAKPPRPQTRLDCTPAQHSCPYLFGLGSLLRPEGKVSISCHGRARVDGQNKLTVGTGLKEKKEVMGWVHQTLILANPCQDRLFWLQRLKRLSPREMGRKDKSGEDRS